MDDDVVVVGDLVDQGVQAGPHQAAAPGGVQFQGVAPQAVLSFHQVHLITLVGQGQGGGHAADPAADHQGPLVDAHRDVLQGLEQAGFGHAHVHQVLAFRRGPIRFILVHPGALVANIGHLKEILVEAGAAQHILEDGLVGGGAAGRHHHPVQVVLGDLFHHLGLGILGAAKEVILDIRHIGNIPGVFHDGRDIGHPADIEAAVADKHPDPGLLHRSHPRSGGYSFSLIRVPRAEVRGWEAAAAAALPSITDWGMSLGPLKAPQE